VDKSTDSRDGYNSDNGSSFDSIILPSRKRNHPYVPLPDTSDLFFKKILIKSYNIYDIEMFTAVQAGILREQLDQLEQLELSIIRRETVQTVDLRRCHRLKILKVSVQEALMTRACETVLAYTRI